MRRPQLVVNVHVLDGHVLSVNKLQVVSHPAFVGIPNNREGGSEGTTNCTLIKNMQNINTKDIIYIRIKKKLNYAIIHPKLCHI